MKCMKKFEIVLAICLMFLLGTVCFANNITISEIDFTVPDLIEGNLRPRSKDIQASPNCVSYTGRIFTNLSDNSIMKETDTFEKETEYKLKLTFKAKDGYELANLMVSINGEKVKVDYTPETDTYAVEKVFETITRPKPKVLKSVEFEIPGATEGEVYADSYKVKTNLSGKFEKVKFNDYDNPIEIRCSMAAKEVYTSSFQINCSIDLDQLSDLYSPALVELDDDLVITINGEEIEYRVSKEYDKVTFIEWVDPEWTTSKVEEINDINFTITAPKVGEKPATTAEASYYLVHISRVLWEPADETFAPGKAYTVKIYWVLENKNNKHLAKEVNSTINNTKAKYGYKDNNGIHVDPYSELNFPKLEGEVIEEPKEEVSTKVEWSKASNWAEPDLEKANEKKIIPQVFDKVDLTDKITRKEFAHVAVKLYEAVSGKKAEVVENNPFKDTSDEEVLKAYNLGITAGMSPDTFEPDTLISREQLATMMTRALSKAGVDTKVDLSKVTKFPDDAEIGKWYIDSVYYMSNIGLIKGFENGTFGAKGDATREQSIVISLRSVEKVNK